MWIVFAGLAALCFGLRGILYHYTSQLPLSRTVLLCGAFSMGAIICGVTALLSGQPWTSAALVGIQMGVFSFVANASMFKGFAVGKASLVAIITALPAVLVVIGAYVMWGEALKYTQLAAFVVIVAGILLVRYSNDLSLKNLQGAQWGLLSLVMFACNDLSGSWSTKLEAPLFPTLFFMFASGSLCYGIWWLKDRLAGRRYSLAAATAEATVSAAAEDGRDPGIRWSERRTFLTGMLVGTTNAAGMMMIVTAFDHGKAGLVSAVTALNVLIVLLYTRFVVKESFTRLEITGMACAFGGILFLRLIA
ncbi:EamA-like transporter family protein [Paenibacillus sp. BK033]|uniref:EamA family transporter n=1 Tax=Paenibacillus sp. BK033 TaxID=2512133 RepID=UPI001042BC87|nr:EamA family transporter [Paenibacillus sp. BK033]TCM99337.1 EamA-like transporter family protein [Paenibacillus sp. BK033]